MKTRILTIVLIALNLISIGYSQNIKVDTTRSFNIDIIEMNSRENLTRKALADSIQTDSLKCDTAQTSGSFSIHQDLRLDRLLEKYVKINEEKCPDLVQGYRIQIYSSSGTGSSQRAREERAKFLTFYPNVSAYNDYDAPNFRVRVGDFRTKLEAEELKKQVSQEFPSCFIVPDYINTELVKKCE